MLKGSLSLAFMFTSFVLLACSNGMEDVTTRCKAGAKCGGVTKVLPDPASSLELASNVVLSKAERAALFRGESLRYRNLSETFCKKAYETRAQCPISNLLVNPVATSEEFMCNFSDGTKLRDGEFAMTAKATANGKPVKFSLIANDGGVLSTSVSGASAQKITWAHQPTHKGWVRFVDLASLQLRDDENVFGANFNADSLESFELRVEGKTYLSKANLMASKSPGKLDININALFELKKTPACAISQKYLDDAETASTEIVKELSALERYEGLSETEAILKLESLEVELPKEKQRKTYAMDTLGVNPNIGCWGDTTLRNLQILVEGGLAADGGRRTIDEDADNPRKPEGNQDSYTFQMSDNLRINGLNTDSALFGNSEKKLGKNDFSGDTTQIGSLRFLKIRRNGFNFESPTHNHCYGGFLGTMQSCYQHFRNYEVNITKLNSVKILVNDQLAYERKGIGHTFNKDSLVLTDTSFTANLAWRTLMARSDCKAVNEPAVPLPSPTP